MGRCSCRRSLERAGLHLAAALGIASAASAGPPDPLLRMGFTHPLLWCSAEPVPIDIGADGRTDFLIAGPAVLNGTTLLPGHDVSTLHVLVQEEDGSFRHAQAIFIGSMSLAGRTADLNGDGLEDAVLLGDRTIAPLLQRRSGRLDRRPETPRGSRYSQQVGVTPEGGRVLTTRYAGEGTYEIEIHRLTPEETFLRTYFAVDSLLSDQHWVASAVDRLLLIQRKIIDGRAVYAGRVFGEGLETPERTIADAPGEEALVGGIASGRRRLDLWTWVIESPLTIQEIGLSPDGAIRVTRADASWVPPYFVLSDDEIRSAMSLDSRYLHLSGSDGDAFLLKQDGDGTSILARWRQNKPCAGIILGGAGDPRLLVQDGSCFSTAEPRRFPEAAHAPRELQGEIVASHDWNADGLPDLVFKTWYPPRGIWLAAGIPGYPFFSRAAQLTTENSGYEHVATSDLDGDGHQDLLLYSNRGEAPGPLPFFWDGWRLRSHPGGRHRMTHSWGNSCADVDGDGSAEFITFDEDSMRFAGWSADRRPEAVTAVDVSNLQLGWSAPLTLQGDVDGDGRAELLAAHRGARNTYSLLQVHDGPPARLRQAHFWTQIDPIGGAHAVDLDGDGDSEMLYFGTRALGAWDFDPNMRLICRLEAFPTGKFLKAADVDLDGTIDLVFADGRVLEIVYDAMGRAEPRLYIYPLAESYEIRASGVLDLEGDGDTDFLLHHGNGPLPVLNETLSPARGRAASPAPVLRMISPQPARGVLRCTVIPRAPGPLRISLHDAAGRRVLEESREVLSLDPVPIRIDPAGRRLAAGVYFLRVSAPRGSATSRIVWLP